MKSQKRILVVSTDQDAGTALVQELTKAGVETVLIARRFEAEAVFDTSTIDLVLVAAEDEPNESFAFAGELKRERPGLSVVMVLRQLELSLVVQGIRQGLTDVLPGGDDLKPLVKRVQALLAAKSDAEELALANATLAQLDPNYGKDVPRDRVGELECRLQRRLRELESEREQVAAAQTAVDAKARQMAIEREAMQRECRELKAERMEWEQTLSELEVREENLVVFERKLREKQDALLAAPSLEGTSLPGTAIELGQAWEAYHKAAKTLAAERAIFRDERMVLTDLEKRVAQRQARLAELDAQIFSQEKKGRGKALPPPNAFAKSSSKSRPPMKTGFFRSILGGVR
jgi:DNA-binding response OmpR family regulator